MSCSYRALWVSFLDFPLLDFTSKVCFSNSVKRLCAHCNKLQLNRIIFHLRPFGDALYASSIFPWSHLIGGKQGVAPAYDPLEILVQEASAAGLWVDAWLNPYRIASGSLPPSALAPNNPAVQKPWLTVPWQGGLYYNPALPETIQLVAQGVREIVANYSIAAVQFDDYFYPTTAPELDRALYLQYGAGLPLEEWRRENVNRLVRTVYQVIQQTNPHVQFGISPHGNDWRNRCQQYSDTALWMREPGYLDFLLPQLYYGFTPTLQDGQIVAFASGDSGIEGWLARKRHPQLALYFGLPAYLVDENQAQDAAAFWKSGQALTRFVQELDAHNADGYAFFRATNLLAPSPATTLPQEYAGLCALPGG